MACEKCGESRYWTPQTGCIVCKREETKERFVITLTDEQFEKLSNRNDHLTETLFSRHGNIEVLIQREEE